MADAARDPAFVAEMRKSKLEVTYSSGASIQNAVTDYLGTPPAVIKKVQMLFDRSS